MFTWLRHRTRLATILAIVLSGALVTTMVVRTSQASFNSTTTNGSNSWATGSVIIGDDSTGTALFNSATDGNLTGGQTLTRCIKVTYTGTNTTGVSVKLYGTATGTLAQYLTVTISQGSGGQFGNCTGFSGTQIYSNTLQDLNDNHATFANGLGTFAPTANPQSAVYQVAVTVSTSASAQAKTAGASFTWEAQG